MSSSAASLPPPPPSSFLAEAEARLPGPLTVLLGLVPAHRSPRVRRAGVDLCRAVLVAFPRRSAQTSSSLLESDGGDENGGDRPGAGARLVGLRRAAMEGCLSLLGDDDASVSSASGHVLMSYRRSMGEPSWREFMSDDVVPRLVDLMEGLPTLAQSGCGGELRRRMKLVSGYLVVSLDTDQAAEGERGTRGKSSSGSEIGAALACESVSLIIRRSLTDIFRLDYDSVAFAPKLESKLIIEQSLTGSLHRASGHRFLYLQGEDVSAAMQMVYFLGLALGRRRGALFVDCCIADVYGASDEVSHHGKKQIVWLDKWAGLVVAANEILSASFNIKNQLSSITLPFQRGMDDMTDRSSNGGSTNRGKSKILRLLASSILPIVTRSSLWDLPTTFETVKRYFCNPSISNEELTHSYLSSLQSGYNRDAQDRRRSGITLDSEASTTALCGNAIFLGYLMEQIGTVSRLLGPDIYQFLPVILFPLLEKTRSCHHHHVQRAAFAALQQITRVAKAKTIASLVSGHFDYLENIMSTQLRLSGGTSHWPQASMQHDIYFSEVIEVVLRGLAEEITNSHGCGPMAQPSSDISSQISILSELIDKMLVTYDNLLSDHLSRNSATVGLLKAFGEAIRFLELATKKSFPIDAEKSEVKAEKPETFLDLLQDTHLPQVDEEDFAETPKEGFAKHHASNGKKSTDPDKNADKNPDDSGGEIRESAKAQYISTAIAIVNSMLFRCCYFLSIPNLQIQVASCEIIISAHKFLTFAECTQKSVSESAESIGNPSLVAINNCWPSILARLHATVVPFRRTQCQRLLTMPNTSIESTPKGIQIFLSKLLDIIASFCQLSGDFMLGRFELDAWPVIAQLIGHHMFLRKQGALRKEPQGESGRHRAIAEMTGRALTNKVPVLSLLDCISRIFGSKQTGLGLGHLVPAAGTLVMPFLADDGDVGNAAMTAMKTLLAIDCDSMWRALLVTCGECTPTRPFKSTHCCANERNLASKPTPKSVVTGRAKELVDYASSLPEQLFT